MTEPTADTEQPEQTPAPRTRRRRAAATDTPPVPFELLEEPCPAGCIRGNVLGFDQSLGQILHIECQECLGVGVIEVQVDTGD
jgi:hypothetical protein